MVEQVDLLQQLRRVLENDKVFIGSEFLSFYARIVFGKKPEHQTAKNASILAKEFKALLESIKVKQKDSGVNIVALDSFEQEIVKVIGKTFTTNTKIVDGDICLDKFKELVSKNNVLNSEKATEYLNKYLYQEILDQPTVSLIEERFMQRKCLFNTIGQYQALYNFISTGHQNAETFNDFLQDFNNVLQNALMETKMYSAQNEHTVAMSEEEIKEILTRELGRERISTRYKTLDRICNGGFEKGRVYMFGGVSGGGKSLTLVNLAYMSLRSLQDKAEQNIIKDEEPIKKKGVLYLSLENSIEETKMRFVCCGLGLRKHQIDESTLFDQLHEFENAFECCFQNKNTDLYIIWRSPKSINSLDIMSMINDLERRNDVEISIVYVDYADKLNAINPSRSDQEWRDLGSIIDELKTLAVDYNIPVVTVTQLTTNSYKKDTPLDGSSVAGSRRKFENTDFLAIFDFISRDMKVLDANTMSLETMDGITSQEDWVEIWCTVDKNRDGISNIKFKVYIDYSSYRMVDDINEIKSIFGVNIQNSTIERPDDTSCRVSKKDMTKFL